jgi:large subunit ribosomal protein L4
MTAQAKSKAPAEQKLEIQVLGNNGKVASREALDPRIAQADYHDHILYQVERYYQANFRQGTRAVKDRSMVSGTGKKPWKQKGTGRARHGSMRSPIWIKGGVSFGPMPKDFSYALPKKILREALVLGLKKKAQDGLLYLVDDFTIKSGKTKDCSKTVELYGWRKPLVITGERDVMTLRSGRNISALTLTQSRGVSAHDVLFSRECVMTRGGYQHLLKRLQSEGTSKS